MILIRLKGVAKQMMKRAMRNSRVEVEPQGSLPKKLNGLSKSPRTEAGDRDYRSPNPEADPRPARAVISSKY